MEDVGKPRKIDGKKSEKKADKSTFIVKERKNSEFVYNKNNTLMLTISAYELNSARDGYTPVKLNNMKLLDSMVKKNIYPHFKSYANTDESFSIGLYSDIEGNIKEICISYPKEAKLPIMATESFEDDVLSSDLKLIFDKNISYFRGTTSVDISCYYSIGFMQKGFIRKK